MPSWRSGGAGTGKSFVLRLLLDHLPKQGTVATGPTGVAACHLGGMTLHAFASLRPDGTPPKDPLKVGTLSEPRLPSPRAWVGACLHTLGLTLRADQDVAGAQCKD